MRSVKIKEYFKIVKPSYKYYKITPNNSIRNQTTHKIARSIAAMYKNIFRRIEAQEKKLVKILGKEFMMGTKFKVNAYEKVGYFIYMEKGKVEFYFIVPDLYEKVIIEKLNDSWQGITVKQVESLPEFKKSSTKLVMDYSKEDALSLATDRRSNELLKSNLNVVNVLKEKEKVGIFYNFVPTTQHTWRNEYKHTIEKVNKREPVDKEKGNLNYIAKYGFKMLFDLVDSVLVAFSTGSKKENKPIETFFENLFNNKNRISDSTVIKENATVLETQILIMSEGGNKLDEANNARSLAQSFETITEDNRLVSKPYKKDFKFTDYKLKTKPFKTSDIECQNFISLAGREILDEYGFIDKVETTETQVPEELRSGVIGIGDNIYRGNKQPAYLTSDKEYRNLTLMLIGPTRAGKSTLIGNISKDAINNGECIFLFDFIKNCDLSNEIAELFPADKVLNIECNDFNNIQGLGYNEVGIDSDPFKQYDNAKRQTTQLMALVNSINADDAGLSAKMERYLTSAALVVFISGGSIKDVFDVLQDQNKRHSFISRVKEDQQENMEEYMRSLTDLDDYDKEGNLVGSKLNLVVGIIDRLNKLKANTFMELMLKKGTEGNFDLSEEIQKNQVICLRMPEDMFSTDAERDVYTTYWITKLWLALQARAKKVNDRSKHTKVNIIIDEIYQVNNTEKFLTEKLSRLAKFTAKPIISCHYINQLKHMRQELRSANASYMLISGCDKNNYNEFKEELRPYNMEDLLNLKRHHSLNIIKYGSGYAKFITKLPPPIYN